MYAAPDMGPFSGAYAAGFFSLAEKSSLEKNLGPFDNFNNNLTNSYWSIGSTMNVKEDRAQTREMRGMETQFQCG
jgi:hypothetical protein